LRQLQRTILLIKHENVREAVNENCCSTRSCPTLREGMWQRTGATSASRHYVVLNDQFHAPAVLLPENGLPVPIE